jgi:hypothetical protein
MVLQSALLLRGANWFKSSKSGPNCDNCVEVAFVGDGVGVRDSKDKTGPAFLVGNQSWRNFVRGVRTNSFGSGTAAA